ncbi:MAG: glycosyl transferase [Crocinitomicaceae bacterium]|nr:glycosyl transferase [Crocinitomicaceae bacterium]|tara:strand:- start:52998 stop:53996 length:999 start_codon:yes stop_codon:yes gene_type:complete
MPLDVSIVIPCYNEQDYIGQCIDSFFQNAQGISLEVLVIDGMSSDGTRKEIAKKQSTYPNAIRIIDNPKKKTPFALNLGIEHATGTYTLIASAHSSFDADYISSILTQFNDIKADIIGGVMETRVLNETSKSLSIVAVLSNKFGVGNSMFRVGIEKPTEVDTVPFGIYKTEMLKTIGGYDVRLIRNHDIEMSKRILALGHKIVLVPKPKCYYYARETFTGIYKNNFRNGNWNIKTVYITKKFSSLSLRHFIPLVFVMSIVLPLIGGLLFSWIAILSTLSLLMYSVLVLSQALKIKKENSRASVFYAFLCFFVLHFGYGLGSLVGLFSLKKLM